MVKDINTKLLKDSQYISFFQDIKRPIHCSHVKAAVSINRELLRFYWGMTQKIVEKQKQPSWGDGFLQQVSRDLQKFFPI
jgi:hypothetical protein